MSLPVGAHHRFGFRTTYTVMQYFGSAVLVTFLLLAGCATSPSGTPEEQVARRAQERLDALMGGDLDKAMEYTTPAYRQANTRGQYGALYAGVGNWTEARVREVACEGERCDVKILVSYEMSRPRITNTRPLDEVWIQVNGQWSIYLN